MASDAEDSSGLPPSVGQAQNEVDAEMTAMPAWAVASVEGTVVQWS